MTCEITTEKYDFFDPYCDAFNRNPFPSYTKLREVEPIFYSKSCGAWIGSTYQVVVDIQQDARLSTNIVHWEHFNAINTGDRPDLKIRSQGIQGGSGSSHIQLKKTIIPALVSECITNVSSFIEACVKEKLESLRGRSEFDVVQDFAKRIPITVISHLLGIPAAFRQDFFEFASAFIELYSLSYSANYDADAAAAAQKKVTAGMAMIKTIIEEKRSSTAADGGLIEKLVQAQRENLDISDSQLLAAISEMVAAGGESTVLSIAYNIYNLSLNPAILSAIKSQPEKWLPAVQEILRYDSFLKSSPRFSMEDFIFAGAPIKRGQMVLGMVGAAQRDPSVFPNPDVIDIGRDNSKSLSFGRSGHACIGRHLALAETTIAVSRFFEAFPDLQVVSEPTYSPNKTLRQMISLKVQRSV